MSRRNGDFIVTFTGNQFWPLDPCPNGVNIYDIAHALSNICRFTGHTKKFYCVTPETKILKEDLRWIRADLLQVGDRLIGFDENTPHTKSGGRHHRRRLAESVVKSVGIIHRPCYRLVLSDGTELRSSSDHPWLVASKLSRNQKWETTQRIADAINGTHFARGRYRRGSRYMLRFFNPWDCGTSIDHGYISGMFDGEGHVSRHSGDAFSCGMAQKNNISLEKVKKILTASRIGFGESVNNASGVHCLILSGAWHDRLRFLGIFRPERLIEKVVGWFRAGLMNREAESSGLVKVVGAHFQGECPVVALETSSRTYFADGFGAHNSVAEHSVRASWQFNRYPENMQALLHDASEAYICDLAKPVKKHIPGYDEIEAKLMFTICEKFLLPWPFPPAIKDADNRMLWTEKRDLMRSHSEWRPNGDPYPFRIEPWAPERAEREFLKRFEECKV